MKQMGVTLEDAKDLRDLYLDKNTGLNLLCCGRHIYIVSSLDLLCSDVPYLSNILC